jgi:hypothetical protein
MQLRVQRTISEHHGARRTGFVSPLWEDAPIEVRLRRVE